MPNIFPLRISLWDVSQIVPGTDRVAAIEQHLVSASVILVLVSAFYLASHDHEIEHALQRQKTDNVPVIPILLHPVDWPNTRLTHLQPLPGNGMPIALWPNQDAALVEVVASIHKALPEIDLVPTHAPSHTFPPLWNIPYPRNPFFTGRDDLLTRIHTQLLVEGN